MSRFEDLKKQMIDYQLSARGLRDKTVLSAISAVPREEFVPTELVEFSYSDSPLPIAASQTISQPLAKGYRTWAMTTPTSCMVTVPWVGRSTPLLTP